MQTGNIYKHGKWWVLRYYETVLQNGRPKRERVIKKLALIDDQYRTQSSVRQLADEILAPLNAGAAPESVDSVRHFLKDIFLPYCDSAHKPSTARGYRHVFNRIVQQDGFCNMRLRKVRTVDVHKLLNAIAQEKTNTGKPRSHRSLRNTRNFLSAGFKYAKNQGLIAENPVRDVITPKGAPQKQTYAYSLDEVTQMLAVLDEPARTLILTAALTGLSKSELQGLKWTDFAGDELQVGRAVWNGIVTDTKTPARQASVPVLPFVADALQQHKSRNGYNEWVFHGDTGNPLRLDNFAKRVIRPAFEEAGIEWHGFHAFRRGLATNLYELGCPEKIAQAILRHADVATTMQFYIKARPDKAQAAMAKLGAAFRKSEKKLKRKSA
jgi:integrase